MGAASLSEFLNAQEFARQEIARIERNIRAQIEGREEAPEDAFPRETCSPLHAAIREAVTESAEEMCKRLGIA